MPSINHGLDPPPHGRRQKKLSWLKSSILCLTLMTLTAFVVCILMWPIKPTFPSLTDRQNLTKRNITPQNPLQNLWYKLQNYTANTYNKTNCYVCALIPHTLDAAPLLAVPVSNLTASCIILAHTAAVAGVRTHKKPIEYTLFLKWAPACKSEVANLKPFFTALTVQQNFSATTNATLQRGITTLRSFTADLAIARQCTPNSTRIGYVKARVILQNDTGDLHGAAFSCTNDGPNCNGVIIYNGDPTDPVTPKPPVVPPPSGGGRGGGGTLKDSDLADVGGGGYEPEGGRYGGGGVDPGYDSNSGGGEQPQAENSGQIAGIVSAIGAALVGAASGYFAYQKKKLCFKLQGGQDPESGNQHTTQSEPQVMSTLIKSS